MKEFWAAYGSQLLSFIAGLVSGSFLTLRIKKSSAQGNANIVDQRSARADGDIVGRDKSGK